jgi:hypothetical protein
VERMKLQANVYYHVSSTEKVGGPLIYSWQTRQFQETSLSMSINLTRSPDLKLCPPADSYSAEQSFSSHLTSDREDSPEVSSMNFRTGVGKYEFWAALEPIWNPKVTVRTHQLLCRWIPSRGTKYVCLSISFCLQHQIATGVAFVAKIFQLAEDRLSQTQGALSAQLSGLILGH